MPARALLRSAARGLPGEASVVEVRSVRCGSDRDGPQDENVRVSSPSGVHSGVEIVGLCLGVIVGVESDRRGVIVYSVGGGIVSRPTSASMMMLSVVREFEGVGL